MIKQEPEALGLENAEFQAVDPPGAESVKVEARSAARARPRALMIAPQPFYTPRGTPFSVYYRTMVLAEQGVDVDLLTYGQGEDVDLPNVRIVRIPAFRFLGPVKVGPSFKKLFLDVFMIIWTIALLIRNRYQFVHAHEEAVFWCRWLKPLFRFLLIYDMHSSLTQQLSNFEFTRSKLLIGIFRWLEDSALRAADVVITICPDLRDQVLEAGVPPERHVLIENSIFEDVRLVRREAQKAEPKQSVSAAQVRAECTGPMILYAGTFEPYQGLDLLIESVPLVARQCPEVSFVLVGGTPAQVAEARALAEKCGAASHCRFIGQVSKAEALQFTALADVLVSPRRHGTNTPLKIYEQLASGRPLVATRIRSHTQVLTDDVCTLVEPQAEAIAAGILEVINDKAAAAQRAQRAQELYAREYARPVYMRKIRDVIALVT